MNAVNGKRPAPILVRLPRASYPILIEEGLLARAGEVLERLLQGRKVFILCDTTVWKLWGKEFLAGLRPYSASLVLVPPGERTKRLRTVEKIAAQLLAQGAERSSILLAFGGGVIGDMGGFAASTFLRGIAYAQIPTTLLAQVDSAIGGKTGVNLALGKNLVGTFYQPRMVLADPAVLKTLPERQFRAGLFEVIKYAVIGDPRLFRLLRENRASVLGRDSEILEEVIRACAALKSRIVSRDEKESDLRRILNFGHTVGHALEAATRYARFEHGEAVAWGMLAATELAVEEKLLDSSEAERIRALVISYGPVPALPKIEPAAVLQHLAVDKKVRDRRLHFVLPVGIGKVRIVAGISPRRVTRILKELQRSRPFARGPVAFRRAHLLRP